MFERFFDEAGGMQLVIHSPYGSRLNRAWGLALRKRFCRKFNFELQAAATEDNIVLSLTTAHSFELDEVARYLHSASVRAVLIQAMLDAPMFTTRWRWVAGVALALPRFRGGKKVPPQFARMEAEDLIAAVFPDQIACAENLVGEREIPDHPLVSQTIADCLNEAMDIDGLERLLGAPRSGRDPRRRARPDRALAARARSAVGAALRLSRRRAARGAPHPGGDGPALARSRERLRARPARPRGDRAGARRSLARPGQRRRNARCAALARLPRLQTEAEATPGWGDWLARWRARSASRGCKTPSDALDPGRAAAAIPGACGPKRGSSRRSRRRPDQAGSEWSRESWRWSKSCAAGWRARARHRDRALAAPLGLEPRRRPRALAALETEGCDHARPLHAGRR